MLLIDMNVVQKWYMKITENTRNRIEMSPLFMEYNWESPERLKHKINDIFFLEK